MPSLSGDFLQHSKIVRNSNWVQLLTTCKNKAFFNIRNRLNVFLTNYFRHLTEVDSVGLQSTNAMNHDIATWNEWKFGGTWNTEVSLLSNKKLIRVLSAPNVNLIIPSRWNVTLKLYVKMACLIDTRQVVVWYCNIVRQLTLNLNLPLFVCSGSEHVEIPSRYLPQHVSSRLRLVSILCW